MSLQRRCRFQWNAFMIFHVLPNLLPIIFKSRERCKVSSNLLLNVNTKELKRDLCQSKGTLHRCVLNFKSINKNIVKSIQTKKPGPCCPPPNLQRSESPQSHRHGAPPWKWRWKHQSHIIYLGNPWKSSEFKWWFPRSISLSAEGNSSHDPPINTTSKQPWQPSSLGLSHLISFTPSKIWSLFKFLSPFCRPWYHLHPSSDIVGSRWNLGNFPRHIGSAIQFRSSPQPRRLEHVRWDKHGG